MMRCVKGSSELANLVNPDQTAPKEQFDLVSHFLLRPFCVII